MMSESLLRVRGLSVDFATPAGAFRAVDSVDLDLARGETLGVVGESGSGKSAMLRGTMGLLPADTASRSGSVVFDGHELVGRRRRDLRGEVWGREMSLVFQNPMTSLNPVVRIGRQVGEVITGSDSNRAHRRARAIDLLNAVGIPEPARRLRQYPHELSGGMRQRIAIAIAIAGNPKLLLADEPTTALDVTVQKQILDMLGELIDARNMAMILVTHDLGLVATRTDNIVVMYAGQVVERAPTRELFRSTRMPYTEALLRSIPRLDHEPHARLDAIAGRPPTSNTDVVGCRFAARCPYVQPRCHEEMPPLLQSDTAGHLARCWYPLGTDAGKEAAARNGVAEAGPRVRVASSAGGGDG
jgi:oligopeptide/dipeptide ABC transporter ATP-binding protein